MVAPQMSGADILWRETGAETFEAPVFQGERTADLAIIGGGFTGCSAALEAAGRGADVVVLEGVTIGHGGSGRNVGLVNAGLWLPPEDVCEVMGDAAGERLNTFLAGAPQLVFDLIERHEIACEAQRAGTLHLAHAASGVAQLAKRHAQLLARGAPVTLLNAVETAARTGSGAFCGALHDARAGTVQPLAYARGLARAAQGQGAQIHEYSPAISAEHIGGKWVIRTERGKLYADRLLIATNAYHQPVRAVSLPGVPAVHYFQIATEPLSESRAGAILPGGEGAWDTATVMSSFRRDAAGRVIVGGIGDGGRLHQGWAGRKLARVFPELDGVRVTHAWAGRISMTSDHVPRIMRMAPAKAYAVFGYSGRGIGPGTAFGRTVARALLDETETDLPVTPVEGHAERLCGLKSLAYEAGARAFHLVAAWR